MHPRRFSLIAGIVMIAIAVLSFVPGLNEFPVGLPALKLETSYGFFLGLFAMNILNKIALLLFGMAGILAATAKNRSLPASVNHAKWVFFGMGIAAILGMIPATNTFFGYWPLFGNEAIMHGVFAAFGAYFGYRMPVVAQERLEARHLDKKAYVTGISPAGLKVGAVPSDAVTSREMNGRI